MGEWLASCLWMLEQWGAGYVLPGTLPTGTDEGDLISVHALDTAQPVAQQLAAEEERLSAAITQGGTP